MPTTSTHPNARCVLLTGPAGSGKTHRALERIRLAATTPGERGRGAAAPGTALLVLPTYSQALHLERVALSRWDARAILDDPFTTFTSAGERFLEGFRVRALPTAVERDGLMDEALAACAVPAFDAVRDRAGFRARLLRLVKEAKQSGLPPAETRERLAGAAGALEPGARERLAAFLQVFEAYDRLLERAGLEDHEDTLRRLLEQLRSHPPARPPSSLAVDGFDDFTPVEQGILDALADAVRAAKGEVLVTLPWDEARPSLFAASASVRRHLLGRGFIEERLDGFPRAPGTGLAALAKTLFLPGAVAPSADPGRTVRVVVAGDPEDEAEALARAARRVYEEEGLLRGWRDLGVVARRLDAAGPRILDAFSRLGIPVRLIGTGEPLAGAALVRAVKGPLAWFGGQALDAPSMLAWLRWRAYSGDGALDAIDDLEIRWRTDGYPVRWEDFASEVKKAGLPIDDLAAHARRIAEVDRGSARELWRLLADAIRDVAPLPPSGGLAPDGTVLDGAADHRRAHAAAARDRLLALAGGFGSAAARTGLGAEVDASRAVRTLLDAVERTQLVIPDRRIDAVNVMDAEEARFWELSVVFVAGLAQGQFPLHPRDDVLLRDDDREALKRSDDRVALPLARDREVRERRLFYGAVTRARKRVVLFRPGFDARGGVQAASPFVREIERVLGSDVPTLVRPVGRAAPGLEECFTPSDLSLFAAARVGEASGPADERRLAAALLTRGDPTLRHRAARWGRSAADPFGESATWRERFERSVACVSATSLRTALACRRRFFYGQVVGIVEDTVPFAGPGYGARERGALVHEVLHRALLAPSHAAEDLAAEVIADAASRRSRDLSAPDAIDRELEAAELARIVRLLRRREASLARPLAPLPEGLEWAFGGDGGSVLERDGRQLSLRGRIDRVDALDGRAVVIDYKLGKGSVDHAARGMAEGLDPQLALYAAVVADALDLEVVGIEWVAALERNRRGVWRSDALDLAGDLHEESGKIGDLDEETYRAEMDRAVGLAFGAVEDVRRLDHDLQHVDPDRCGICAWRTVCRPRHGRQPTEDEA